MINKVSNVIEISQDGGLPRCYFGVSGEFCPSGEDENLEIDGFLINMEKDTYNVKWYDLLINDTSPTDLANAALLLSQVFGITFPPAPPIPPTNPLLKVNPPSVNTFDIPAYGDGGSDFTIEWLQYMHTDADFPRIYSIGQYPAQNAVSIEGDTLYLWLNGSDVGSAYLPNFIDPYLDTWIHIVVTRKGTGLAVWANGVKIIGTLPYPDAIPTNGLDFYIGSENAVDTYYNGLISNFRWNKGEAVYGIDPPPYPTVPLIVETGTVLLVGQGTDLTSQLTDVTGTNTITANGCTYNTDSGISGDTNGSIQFGTI